MVYSGHTVTVIPAVSPVPVGRGSRQVPGRWVDEALQRDKRRRHAHETLAAVGRGRARETKAWIESATMPFRAVGTYRHSADADHSREPDELVQRGLLDTAREHATRLQPGVDQPFIRLLRTITTPIMPCAPNVSVSRLPAGRSGPPRGRHVFLVVASRREVELVRFVDGCAIRARPGSSKCDNSSDMRTTEILVVVTGLGPARRGIAS